MPSSDTQFKPGNSGGPGRGKRLPQDMLDLLECATPKAIQTAIAALDAERPVVVGSGDSAHCEMVPDWDLRLKASEAVLNRRWGKVAQAITGEDGGPIQIQATDLLGILQKMTSK